MVVVVVICRCMKYIDIYISCERVGCLSVCVCVCEGGGVAWNDERGVGVRARNAVVVAEEGVGFFLFLERVFTVRIHVNSLWRPTLLSS